MDSCFRCAATFFLQPLTLALLPCSWLLLLRSRRLHDTRGTDHEAERLPACHTFVPRLWDLL